MTDLEWPATTRVLVTAGAVILVTGALLPWMTVEGQPVRGLRVGGWLTLAAGALAGGLSLLAPWATGATIATTALGALATAVGVLALYDVGQLGTVPAGEVTPALGLYATLLGGAFVALAGAAGFVLAGAPTEGESAN